MPNDPKQIWLNQPTEVSTMTMKLIEHRLRTLHSRTRRRRLDTLAGPIAISFFSAFSLTKLTPLDSILQALFAFALAWSLAGLYVLGRGMASPVMPSDAGLSTSLEFCRHELYRQRDLVRGNLLWALLPTLLSLGVFVLALAEKAGGLFPKGLPFLLLAVGWIAGALWLRVREQRALEQELDELRDLEADLPS